MIDDVMYGMMPSAKIEKRSSAPPENMFTKPEHRVARLLEERGQSFAVDAGRRDRDSDPVDGEHRQREQHTAA